MKRRNFFGKMLAAVAGVSIFGLKPAIAQSSEEDKLKSLSLLTQYFGGPQIESQIADINEEYLDFEELKNMLIDQQGWSSGQYYKMMYRGEELKRYKKL